MSEFEKTQWADGEFSQNYLDDAEIFLPFRSQFIEVSKSIYGQFISNKSHAKVMDLGCGDGLFIGEFFRSFNPEKIVLVDGSPEMLKAAKKRLSGKKGCVYCQASFQQLLADDPLDYGFDYIYSSLAIHHLTFDEKRRLYTYIYEHLSPGGWFVNYDVVSSPSGKLEQSYLTFWLEWIKTHPSKGRREELLGIPDHYKENPDNLPDTLESQLEMLRLTGFCNVDCFFKYGIFSLFGGSK